MPSFARGDRRLASVGHPRYVARRISGTNNAADHPRTLIDGNPCRAPWIDLGTSPEGARPSSGRDRALGEPRKAAKARPVMKTRAADPPRLMWMRAVAWRSDGRNLPFPFSGPIFFVDGRRATP